MLCFRKTRVEGRVIPEGVVKSNCCMLRYFLQRRRGYAPVRNIRSVRPPYPQTVSSIRCLSQTSDRWDTKKQLLLCLQQNNWSSSVHPITSHWMNRIPNQRNCLLTLPRWSYPSKDMAGITPASITTLKVHAISSCSVGGWVNWLILSCQPSNHYNLSL